MYIVKIPKVYDMLDIMQIEERVAGIYKELGVNLKGENLGKFDEKKDKEIKITGVTGELLVQSVLGGELASSFFAPYDIKLGDKLIDVKTFKQKGPVKDCQDLRDILISFDSKIYLQKKQIDKYKQNTIICVVFIDCNNDGYVVFEQNFNSDYIKRCYYPENKSPYKTITKDTVVENYVIPWKNILKMGG